MAEHHYGRGEEVIDASRVAQASPPASVEWLRHPAADRHRLEAEATPEQAGTPALRHGLTIVALVMALFPVFARAHDAFEIWTIAVVRKAHLELGITMAQSTALRLIDPEMKAGAITFENFAAHRARLEREAAVLCILTTGRKALSPRKIDVELTDENDIAFRIAYPRPVPGRLHFHAACLKKLGAGYGGILDASDAAGNHLGWEQLSFENPNFEITIPAPPAPNK